MTSLTLDAYIGMSISDAQHVNRQSYFCFASKMACFAVYPSITTKYDQQVDPVTHEASKTTHSDPADRLLGYTLTRAHATSETGHRQPATFVTSYRLCRCTAHHPCSALPVELRSPFAPDVLQESSRSTSEGRA
jgi:hypothetical protein